MKGNIIWIASYPKSGNTWFRVFLANLLNEAVSDLNTFQIDGDEDIASSRLSFDSCTGLDSACLSRQEIAFLRPRVYEHLSMTLNKNIWLKTHDAYQTLPDGIPLFPASATKAAIYLIRNPLDIVGSYASHNGDTIDSIIDKMNNQDFQLQKQIWDAQRQLPQFLGSWSGHVKSWTEMPDYPVCLLRYEDMHLESLATFGKAVAATGIEKSPEEIVRAINASTFDKLKKMEQESGFRERPHTSGQFFRAGKIGSWRDSLTEKQAGLIIESHADTMRRHGYLDVSGNPVF
jgi:hypothetical protein